MIASVRGTVLAVRLDTVVVEVGGVGLQVLAPPETCAGLRVGAETLLHTSLIVREDSLTLHGFTTADARDLFETVQAVAGIGPRLAMAMLAVHDPDALRAAVAAGDVAALKRVPGIGPKVAQRILLELTGKLGPVGPGAVAAAGTPGWAPTVQQALEGLGWSQRQAEEALAAVKDTATDHVTGLRAALRHLGRTS